jgi:hypothetical protein
VSCLSVTICTITQPALALSSATYIVIMVPESKVTASLPAATSPVTPMSVNGEVLIGSGFAPHHRCQCDDETSAFHGLHSLSTSRIPNTTCSEA